MEKSAAFVFLVQGERSRKVAVTLGFQDGSSTEVTSVLDPAAAVISPGKAAPVDGTPVRIQAPK